MSEPRLRIPISTSGRSLPMTTSGRSPCRAFVAALAVTALVTMVAGRSGSAGAEPSPEAYGGLKTVTAENDHLRLVVVPEVGGRLTEVVSKRTGLNHLLLESKAFQSYRDLGIGEGFLLLPGGLFDVVMDNGHQGYPGVFQCAPYEVRVETGTGSPAVTGTCRRGAVEITRRMTLLSGAPRLLVEAAYRNVSAEPIETGVNLRVEFPLAANRRALVVLPVEGNEVGLFENGRGLDRLAPGGGWLLIDTDTQEKRLLLFDAAETEFVRGLSGGGLCALTFNQRPRRLPPGETVEFALELALVGGAADATTALTATEARSPAEVRSAHPQMRAATGPHLRMRTPAARDRAATGAALALILENLPAVRRHPSGLSTFAPWGLVSRPRVAYRRTRPWTNNATCYGAGDDVKVVATLTPLAKEAASVPAAVEVSGALQLPDARTLRAETSLAPGREGALVFRGEEIGAATGPFRLTYAVSVGGQALASGAISVHYHHRGDPRLASLLSKANSMAAEIRAQRDQLKHAGIALPWIEKRIEYAENCHEIGDYRYRPFCHGRAREEMFDTSEDAIHLLEDAIACGQAVLAGRDPAAEVTPGGHIFCYDLAPYGARIVPFDDAAFREKLATFKAKADNLAAKPEAAPDIGWYMALYLLGRRALEHGIRADDGDAAAAAHRLNQWLDDVLARIDRWPNDGWRQGKFRFPFDGLIDFYSKNIERHRGYGVWIPSCYDGKTARPLLVDPNSYGSLLPPGADWDVPRDPDPASRAGSAEVFGYFCLGPGHTNTYSRSGNPEDVRRVIEDAATFLRLDRKRFYCTGGSLNADATGNLGNSMLETWAAVAPFSQGAQIWTRKSARLPRINFQAGAETATFIKGVRAYREQGLYDPAIHLGGLYPGVGHCGMSRDMWQFTFEFFARHTNERPP